MAGLLTVVFLALHLLCGAQRPRSLVAHLVHTPADEAVPGALPGREEAVRLAALGHVTAPLPLRDYEQLRYHALVQASCGGHNNNNNLFKKSTKKCSIIYNR